MFPTWSPICGREGGRIQEAQPSRNLLSSCVERKKSNLQIGGIFIDLIISNNQEMVLTIRFCILIASWDGYRRCRCCYWPGLWPAHRVQPSISFTTIFPIQEKIIFRVRLRQFTFNFNSPLVISSRDQFRLTSTAL